VSGSRTQASVRPAVQSRAFHGRACGAKLGKIAHRGAIVEHTMGRSEEGATIEPALGVVYPAQKRERASALLARLDPQAAQPTVQ